MVVIPKTQKKAFRWMVVLRANLVGNLCKKNLIFFYLLPKASHPHLAFHFASGSGKKFDSSKAGKTPVFSKSGTAFVFPLLRIRQHLLRIPNEVSGKVSLKYHHFAKSGKMWPGLRARFCKKNKSKTMKF